MLRFAILWLAVLGGCKADPPQTKPWTQADTDTGSYGSPATAITSVPCDAPAEPVRCAKPLGAAEIVAGDYLGDRARGHSPQWTPSTGLMCRTSQHTNSSLSSPHANQWTWTASGQPLTWSSNDDLGFTWEVLWSYDANGQLNEEEEYFDSSGSTSTYRTTWQRDDNGTPISATSDGWEMNTTTWDWQGDKLYEEIRDGDTGYGPMPQVRRYFLCDGDNWAHVEHVVGPIPLTYDYVLDSIRNVTWFDANNAEILTFEQWNDTYTTCTHWTRDETGKPLTMVHANPYAGDTITTWTYDALERVTEQRQTRNGALRNSKRWTYAADGSATADYEADYRGDGQIYLLDSWQYGPDGRPLTSVEYEATEPPEARFSKTWTYDNLGWPLNEHTTLGGDTTSDVNWSWQCFP